MKYKRPYQWHIGDILFMEVWLRGYYLPLGSKFFKHNMLEYNMIKVFSRDKRLDTKLTLNICYMSGRNSSGDHWQATTQGKNIDQVSFFTIATHSLAIYVRYKHLEMCHLSKILTFWHVIRTRSQGFKCKV